MYHTRTFNYKFRPVPKRDDITEIKENARRDSIQPKEEGDHWNTEYNDEYIKHPLGRDPKAKAPPEGFIPGGGLLAPTKEEMMSDYQRTYRGFDRTDVPKRAEPLPPSDIISGDEPIPESTCHAALKEANEGRPPYDNSEAKQRKADGVSSHFYFGCDQPQFDTTYKDDYIARKNDNPSVIDNALQKSHITFDSKAGIGPHTRAMQKKGPFPQLPDPEKMNFQKAHFDVGYDKLNYETTSSMLYKPSRYAQRPESFKAPPCAELANHGPAAGKWDTTYHHDYTGRKGDPNIIDQNDLRATHFDPGHEKDEWPERIHEVPTVRPARLTINLQESNIVFKGDGQGRYQTTSSDLIGNYDRTKDGRGKFVDAREDHLFLGSDKTDYTSTAKDANKLAGTGKPAERGVDLHHLRGTGFATGGTFDPNYDPEPMKKEVNYGPTVKVDSKYFTGTHFALDATKNAGNHWETTYFEDICRPRIY